LEGEGKEGDKAEEGNEFHGKYLYGLGGEGEGIFLTSRIPGTRLRAQRRYFLFTFEYVAAVA
jgi:hypothetical protein